LAWFIAKNIYAFIYLIIVSDLGFYPIFASGFALAVRLDGLNNTLNLSREVIVGMQKQERRRDREGGLFFFSSSSHQNFQIFPSILLYPLLNKSKLIEENYDLNFLIFRVLEIYSGNITVWNDTRIRTINPYMSASITGPILLVLESYGLTDLLAVALSSFANANINIGWIPVVAVCSISIFIFIYFIILFYFILYILYLL
jgi:hypothetical protein